MLKIIGNRKSISKERSPKLLERIFENLAQTKCYPDQLDSNLEHIEALSFGHDDLILNTPLTTDEVEMALKKLKSS